MTRTFFDGLTEIERQKVIDDFQRIASLLASASNIDAKSNSFRSKLFVPNTPLTKAINENLQSLAVEMVNLLDEEIASTTLSEMSKATLTRTKVMFEQTESQLVMLARKLPHGKLKALGVRAAGTTSVLRRRPQ